VFAWKGGLLLALAKRPSVLPNPVEDFWEAELAAIHRAVNEFVPCLRIDFDIEAVAFSGSEGNSLVAVEKAVVVVEELISAAPSSSTEL
jgi:hypothetical protein